MQSVCGDKFDLLRKESQERFKVKTRGCGEGLEFQSSCCPLQLCHDLDQIS